MSFSVVPEPMHYCLILTYVAQKWIALSKIICLVNCSKFISSSNV
jgi:hypothetical protein